MKLLLKGLCPNCRGDITDGRLSRGTLCSRCLRRPITDPEKIRLELEEKGLLEEYGLILNLNRGLKEISELFKKAVGSRPSSIQEVWIRRALLGESFSIIAPTGIGKTLTGLMLSIYFSMKGKRCYLIFPTALLVQQVKARAEELMDKLEVKIPMAYYHSGLSKKEKELEKEKMKGGRYSILITTDGFLRRNPELVSQRFDFVFVDDADSFLRTTKHVDKVVKILGGDDRVLEIAERKILGEEISEEEEEYFEEAKKGLGVLIFSSATSRERRTKKIKLLREIFGFDVGFRPEFLRNVDDYYAETSELFGDVLKFVRMMGKGGIVFTPMALGKEFSRELVEFLKGQGISAGLYEGPDEELIEGFRRGELEVLVGIASFRSPLARGLDLPEAIRYCIFAGVPRIELGLDTKTFNPAKLLALSKVFLEVANEEERTKLLRLVERLRKICPLPPGALERIEKGETEGFLDYARRLILEAQGVLSDMLTPEFIGRLERSKEIGLKKAEEGFRLIVPDPRGYLQGSGRTSRMYVGGLSKGLSLLLVDDEKAFYGLKRRLEYYLDDFTFIEFDERKVKRTLKEVDRDRRAISLALSGRYVGRLKDLVKTYLLIVESPTKAKTIARFFGRPNRRRIGGLTVYEVSTGNRILEIVASLGHLLDLVEGEGFDGIYVLRNGRDFVPVYGSIKRCKKCETQFVGYDRCPNCGSTEFFDKSKAIDSLRRLALETNEVILATDADAEGEKISYDLKLLLRPYNRKIKRMEFHEVTRRAIKAGLENVRDVNPRLVNAQLVRRIEDRWIGFELSKLLQRRFKDPHLSAGRVQTPVLGWVLERTKESSKKELVARIETDLGPFCLRGVKEDIRMERVAKVDVSDEVGLVSPPPPFTTDSMLEEANSILKFSADKTMKLAQELFESGLITYHRTDSTHVSSLGISVAKKYLEDRGMLQLFSPRAYGKEGTHECIRPTRPLDATRLTDLIRNKVIYVPIRLTKDHLALYDLIFKRFISSQAKQAKVLKQKVEVRVGGYSATYERLVEVLEWGFYTFSRPRLRERIRPGTYEIRSMRLLKVRKARPYTQGELVALMKERGIGRPSTYTKIITTIIQRGYVKEVGGLLFGTRKGFAVYYFLTGKYGEFVSEEFTRKLESDMKLIEEGRLDHIEVVRELYEKVKNLAMQRGLVSKGPRIPLAD